MREVKVTVLTRPGDLVLLHRDCARPVRRTHSRRKRQDAGAAGRCLRGSVCARATLRRDVVLRRGRQSLDREVLRADTRQTQRNEVRAVQHVDASGAVVESIAAEGGNAVPVEAQLDAVANVVDKHGGDRRALEVVRRTRDALAAVAVVAFVDPRRVEHPLADRVHQNVVEVVKQRLALGGVRGVVGDAAARQGVEPRDATHGTGGVAGVAAGGVGRSVVHLGDPRVRFGAHAVLLRVDAPQHRQAAVRRVGDAGRHRNEVGVVVDEVARGAVGVALRDVVVVRRRVPQHLAHGARGLLRKLRPLGRLRLGADVALELGHRLVEDDEHRVRVRRVVVADEDVDHQTAGRVQQRLEGAHALDHAVVRDEVREELRRLAQHREVAADEVEVLRHLRVLDARQDPENIGPGLHLARQSLVDGRRALEVVRHLALRVDVVAVALQDLQRLRLHDGVAAEEHRGDRQVVVRVKEVVVAAVAALRRRDRRRNLADGLALSHLVHVGAQVANRRRVDARHERHKVLLHLSQGHGASGNRQDAVGVGPDGEVVVVHREAEGVAPRVLCGAGGAHDRVARHVLSPLVLGHLQRARCVVEMQRRRRARAQNGLQRLAVVRRTSRLRREDGSGDVAPLADDVPQTQRVRLHNVVVRRVHRGSFSVHHLHHTTAEQRVDGRSAELEDALGHTLAAAGGVEGHNVGALRQRVRRLRVRLVLLRAVQGGPRLHHENVGGLVLGHRGLAHVHALPLAVHVNLAVHSQSIFGPEVCVGLEGATQAHSAARLVRCNLHTGRVVGDLCGHTCEKQAQAGESHRMSFQ
eukprot:Rhum_TRINITY_DN19058_c0_g1::Rhum_TRINITY_DN19058_c0_g1_i1::g.169083::m.169083